MLADLVCLKTNIVKQFIVNHEHGYHNSHLLNTLST